MNTSRPAVTPEITLDPSNWEEMRLLGHRMIDDMVSHLSSLHEQPAWQAIPAEVKEALHESLPREGQGEAAVYEHFLQNVLPYPNGNLHPRFFGWMVGNGFPLATLADMLAATITPHMAGLNQAPALVETQALHWIVQMIGMPAGTNGLFVNGGTLANVVALTIARHAKANFDIRKEGLQGEQPKMTVYCSTETHGWAKKAMEVLGLGHKWLRSIPVDEEYRIDIAQLEAAIQADRKDGHTPLCVIGTAGTINTGAIDDLEGLADLCERENLWFHVDGAFGALLKISEKHRHLVRGLERVDSLAFDLHKWMYLPSEIACLLVRDGQTYHDAFAMTSNYLVESGQEVITGGATFADRGLALTREFKALKVWMSLKAYGLHKFATVIEQNIEQVQYLAGLVEKHPELELLAPARLTIACFRYVGQNKDQNKKEEHLNAINKKILVRLQESGTAVPSHTTLQGRFALRVAHANHRTRFQDLDRLVESTVAFGRAIEQEHG